MMVDKLILLVEDDFVFGCKILVGEKYICVGNYMLIVEWLLVYGLEGWMVFYEKFEIVFYEGLKLLGLCVEKVIIFYGDSYLIGIFYFVENVDGL